MWHMTCEMWHMLGVKILSKFKPPSFYVLGDTAPNSLHSGESSWLPFSLSIGSHKLNKGNS